MTKTVDVKQHERKVEVKRTPSEDAEMSLFRKIKTTKNKQLTGLTIRERKPKEHYDDIKPFSNKITLERIIDYARATEHTTLEVAEQIMNLYRTLSIEEQAFLNIPENAEALIRANQRYYVISARKSFLGLLENPTDSDDLVFVGVISYNRSNYVLGGLVIKPEFRKKKISKITNYNLLKIIKQNFSVSKVYGYVKRINTIQREGLLKQGFTVVPNQEAKSTSIKFERSLHDIEPITSTHIGRTSIVREEREV